MTRDEIFEKIAVMILSAHNRINNSKEEMEWRDICEEYAEEIMSLFPKRRSDMKSGHIEDGLKRILGLFDDEDNPWEAYYKNVLVNAIDCISSLTGIKVKKECERCKGLTLIPYQDPNDELNFGEIPCPACNGTGYTTRPATIEDMIDWTVRAIKLKQKYYGNATDLHIELQTLQTPDGGILIIEED